MSDNIPGVPLSCPTFETARKVTVNADYVDIPGQVWSLPTYTSNDTTITDDMYQQALTDAKGYSNILASVLRNRISGNTRPITRCYIPMSNGDSIPLIGSAGVDCSQCTPFAPCQLQNQNLSPDEYQTCTSTNPQDCQITCAPPSIDGNWSCKTCSVSNGKGMINIQGSQTQKNPIGNYLFPLSPQYIQNGQYSFQLPDQGLQIGTRSQDGNQITFQNDVWTKM